MYVQDAIPLVFLVVLIAILIMLVAIYEQLKKNGK